MAQRKIVLIDGSSLAFRAFYSILDLERFKNASGLHTNALYSFHRMIDNILEQFQPTHILVAFDKSERTFRTEKYADYKGGRQKTPSEFKEQMPYLRVFLEAYGIKHYEVLGYEADDIIGTLSHQAQSQDQVIVISGDKDLIQLASEKTTVYITRKGVSDLEAYTPQTIQEKYGITPEQVIDLKGLMGDSSDNYPGITRIGEKTALKLLHQFETVEGMYDRIDELKPSKMKENIVNDEANARMSKDLARILLDAPLEISVEDIERGELDVIRLKDFYQQMNFNTFMAQLNERLGQSDESQQVPDQVPDQVDYTYLHSMDQVHLPKRALVYIETLIANYHEAEPVLLGWQDLDDGKIYLVDPEVAFESELFKTWLSDPTHSKVAFDSKRDRVLAHKANAHLAGIIDDLSIAAYLLDPGQEPTIKGLADKYLPNNSLQADDQVYNKGAKLGLPEDKSRLLDHVATKIHVLSQIIGPLKEDLETTNSSDLYQTMELPLAKVLAKMEMTGIKTQEDSLEAMNIQLLDRLADLEAEIHMIAGTSFNINSPRQLATVLFEDLGLPAGKKTKTGYSTAADVLEKLAHDHEIVAKILDYRQIAKLQGTYLAGLPKYIQADGKIHTRFVQTLTQTGRLSSTDPNLQNIPIRLEEGRKVRQAFVPSQEDWILFGADYSQIELRVLAHISKDSHMQAAFLEGEDIHASTARRVLGISEDQEVDANDRRKAKAVNFGIVYGISDYGLSQNLNISRKEAKDFIDRYFEKYPGVASYMSEIVDQAKQDSYVATLFNRRRYLPDIHASNFNVRSFAERTAMNSPIQGSAADILKVAMIQLDKALQDQGLEARILLQVHDELILEAPKHELEVLKELVPKIMEGAVTLSVPLKVDYNWGDNWYDLK